MKPEMKMLVEQLKRPELWEFDGYNLIFKETRKKFWVANGWFFLGDGTPDNFSLSLLDRWRLWPHAKAMIIRLSFFSKGSNYSEITFDPSKDMKRPMHKLIDEYAEKFCEKANKENQEHERKCEEAEKIGINKFSGVS